MNSSLRRPALRCLSLAACLWVLGGCGVPPDEEQAETAEQGLEQPAEESGSTTRGADGPVTRKCTYHDALGPHEGIQVLANVGGNYVWQRCKPAVALSEDGASESR